MAQHDYVIDNQSAPASRADINAAFQAIVSTNSGATPPSTAFANMLWYDTANDLLKIRNEANSAWITLGTVDQTLAAFNPNFTPATQAEAEAGTNNVKGMSALRVAQAIAALGGIGDVNIQVFTASGTYTPTTGYKRALAFVTGGGQNGTGGSGGGVGNGGNAGNTVIGILNLVGLAAQTVTIGANGTTGGTSSIGSLLSASGGGATAMTGTVQLRGGTGSGGVYDGTGAGSFWGGGAGYQQTTTGTAAVAFGAGGAGGYSSSGNYTGGAGKSGVVVIVEFK